jgi:hypothetical protein
MLPEIDYVGWIFGLDVQELDLQDAWYRETGGET